jgi:hypothetical protein
MGEINDAYRILVGKTLVKYSLGRSGRSLKDNIKICHREMCSGDRRWAEVAEGRVQRQALVLEAHNFRVLPPQC